MSDTRSKVSEMSYYQAQIDLLESIVDELEQIKSSLRVQGGIGKKYKTARVLNPTPIGPNQEYPLITAENGVLRFIWIDIDSDAFEFQLTINGEQFTTSLPELVNYVGQNVLVDNDWTITYLSASPTGPPAALRFQSIQGLDFETLKFSLFNTDEVNTHNLLRYRYFYELYG